MDWVSNDLDSQRRRGGGVLSSKQLLELTGVSRATLNNYIALGLLPRPTVKHPGGDAKAPRLGYFDHSAVELIRQVGELKRQGRSMAEIRQLIGQSKPSLRLTPLAILVADLQDSSRIRAELPPQEYFELLNEFWALNAPILRRLQAMPTKHPGDGLASFFLPQTDGVDHRFRAVTCAVALREAMVDLSSGWRRRKNWFNDLLLNIALHAGEEWLGEGQSAGGPEPWLLGEALEQTARLAGFARDGAIWSSKALIAGLPDPERRRLRYGVRRCAPSGTSTLVPETYAQLARLMDLDSLNNQGLAPVATLPITEIVALLPGPAE
ncbi:MAG TPA: MerR family transcriptional regulator [Desulfurivibrio alkaliphilus]|uniref:MerR family transcriptional regulator n=1 Tax=Desulfurivibrio alkaliphilus TaxID=427923 RepID=A0A7C2TI84_9BACT|nr:MerR family transcriptional regulator [Desulfurivibrio alkaliphilus]